MYEILGNLGKSGTESPEETVIVIPKTSVKAVVTESINS